MLGLVHPNPTNFPAAASRTIQFERPRKIVDVEASSSTTTPRIAPHGYAKMPTRFSKTRKHRGHVSAGHGKPIFHSGILPTSRAERASLHPILLLAPRPHCRRVAHVVGWSSKKRPVWHSARRGDAMRGTDGSSGLPRRDCCAGSANTNPPGRVGKHRSTYTMDWTPQKTRRYTEEGCPGALAPRSSRSRARRRLCRRGY